MQQRLDFIKEYRRVWTELVELLDITSSRPNQNQMEKRLFDRFDVVRRMALDDDPRAGLRLARLAKLSENLRKLKRNRPHIFADFKEQFHDIEHDRYFGWRCEVDTAAYLTEKNIDYSHPDPPDFQVETPHGSVSIECTSAHFRQSEVEAKEKIKDKVSQKSGKSYFKPSTALVIDLTNVYYTALKRGEEFSSPKLKKWVQERIELVNLDIGSVLLIGYHADIEHFKLEYRYDRVDNSPSDGLSAFLEEHFPFGEGSARLRWFPPEP